jgi:hypothetical protein
MKRGSALLLIVSVAWGCNTAPANGHMELVAGSPTESEPSDANACPDIICVAPWRDCGVETAQIPSGIGCTAP